jgi:hypothetical protein
LKLSVLAYKGYVFRLCIQILNFSSGLTEFYINERKLHNYFWHVYN